MNGYIAGRVWDEPPEPPPHPEWDTEPADDAYCLCCDAPTDGCDYCDTCMFGDCPDCV